MWIIDLLACIKPFQICCAPRISPCSPSQSSLNVLRLLVMRLHAYFATMLVCDFTNTPTVEIKFLYANI